jgi:hypothetical protein
MNTAIELWKKYQERVYGAGPMPKDQERECSLAFYAGMEASFWRLSDISNQSADTDVSEAEAARCCEEFRVEIKVAATQANLDRSDGRS